MMAKSCPDLRHLEIFKAVVWEPDIPLHHDYRRTFIRFI
jgi:hypothetical protein